MNLKKKEEAAWQLGLSLLKYPQVVGVGTSDDYIVIYVSAKKISKDLKENIPVECDGYLTKIEFSGKATANSKLEVK